MSAPITLSLKSDRLVRLNDETFTLPATTVLAGALSLSSSKGPHGILEYDHPSYVSTCFHFELGGRRVKHRGLLGMYQLWAPDGTAVRFKDPRFISACGLIEGLNDSREDWFYIRPDGTKHTNRLKYTSCQFELMARPSTIDVRCRYYDQNDDITGYVTIYYSLDPDDLLLRKDIKFYYDSDGKVEDWEFDQGPCVTLEEADAPPNGPPATGMDRSEVEAAPTEELIPPPSSQAKQQPLLARLAKWLSRR